MAAVTTALTESFTSVAGELTKVVGGVLPIALPVIGSMVVVTIGIKVFKKITSKA